MNYVKVGHGLGQQQNQQNAVASEAPRSGSLAEAFAALNGEIESLEKAQSVLFDRVNPALEPLPPQPAVSAPDGQSAPQSPLASATFEYARRVAQVSEAIREITRRISF